MIGFISTSNSFQISAGVNQSTGTSTTYTAPANSFAIVQVSAATLAGFYMVGGPASTLPANSYIGPFYVGPGGTVTVQAGAGGTAHITGVQFTNA